MAQAFIGTSGFSYPHWRPTFYPPGLPQSKWFDLYCQHFNTIEINTSFYRLPKNKVFENWKKTAGQGFVFSVKGSRFITHIKKLKNCDQAVEKFFEAANGLNPKEKITSDRLPVTNYSNLVLWQLPPQFKTNYSRLKKFLRILPKNWHHAFEFRNPSWLNPRTFGLLKNYQAAVVFQDQSTWPQTEKITANFVYLRFHGSTSLYSSNYSLSGLSSWAKKITSWLKQGLDIYAYFNNDALGYAVENAKTLKKLICRKI